MEYLAHSANSAGMCQSLAEHLSNVAEFCAEFAGPFDSADEARLIGLLHDVGKYSDSFQRRLQGLEKGLDHWSNGAWIALRDYHAIAASVAVQGHHIGLQSVDPDALRSLDPLHLSSKHPQGLTPTETDCRKLLERLRADGLSIPALHKPCLPGISTTVSAMIDIKMLFSALVDADFLDTERHFNTGTGNATRPAGASLNPAAAYQILISHMEEVRRVSASSEDINRLRDDLFNACVKSAGNDIGLWTLTAPTGAGKTLAMIAFALRHAAKNSLRRVVVVIPFLSIIEQTAQIYRNIFADIFGHNFILEDHSLTESSDCNKSMRLLAQNWDAPVVITTSVQMLESLFSNRTSACRKLHRLAESVILFDEVQSLPAHLSVPTLAALSRLSQRYRTSIVFSTATQPAFSHLDCNVRELNGSSSAGWSPKEIVACSDDLFNRARRTKTLWPECDVKISWPELAQTLTDYDQALCILNLKRHTRELMSELEKLNAPGVFHLSTSMCPAHRRNVLDKVRNCLDNREKCLLVSTQCVEAGVDIDFPVVFRAFADLSSIAQAAGRCNRNGNNTEKCTGDVHVFVPKDESYPGGGYEQAAQVTKALLAQKGSDAMDINDPAVFEEYYRLLYDLVQPHNQGLFQEIHEAIIRQDFVDVAKLYKIIKQDTINLLVPYDLGAYETLAREVRENGLTSDWVRRARMFSVSLYRPKDDDVVWQRLEQIRVGRDEIVNDWFIYLDLNDYQEREGLLPPNGPALWIA